MKYYLLKRIDYAENSNFNERQYVPITEVTAWTRSKEIMLYDEKIIIVGILLFMNQMLN